MPRAPFALRRFLGAQIVDRDAPRENRRLRRTCRGLPCRESLALVLAAWLAVGCVPPTSTGRAGSAGGSGIAPTTAAVLAALQLSFSTVASGLDAPVGVVDAGDRSGRLFVVEQSGRIVIVRGDSLSGTFLDISDKVSSGGERGLLGLAFHPSFPNDRRFFVDYTDTDGNTVIASFLVPNAAADAADPASEQVLLHIDQPFPNHNGGQLAFGPDGMLYVGMGDGGSGGDPMGNGQRTDTLLGKILRIDVDHPSGNRPYGIPAGNPYAAGGGLPEIWAIGLRNPWRFSFDRQTGDLWIGDVGQDAWEEIDHQPNGAGAGANYGWNVMEGNHCYPPGASCDPSRYVPPVAEYGHDQGCAVIGGYVGRSAETAGAVGTGGTGGAAGAAGAAGTAGTAGAATTVSPTGSAAPAGPAGSAIPADAADARLLGVYLFGDDCSGNIWGLDAAHPEVGMRLLAQSGRTISSFGEDASGRLYLTDLAHGDLVRIASEQ